MNDLAPSRRAASISRTCVPQDLFRPDRLAECADPSFTVLDLFAGAGGFSLGCWAAGATVTGSVEIDSWASETLRINHGVQEAITGDIQALSDDDLLQRFGKPKILVGGPPCQGFSVANNAARKVGNDPRNSLFREFMRAVRLLKPDAVLFENVPGLLKKRIEGGQPVISVIEAELKSAGFHPYYTVLYAHEFGVPQLRPRLFIAGYRDEVRRPFPDPTHVGAQLGSLFDDPGASPLTLWEAISDLPRVEPRGGAEEVPHSSEPQNDFQALMRAGHAMVYNHKSMRHSKRLIERFKSLKWGESSADAVGVHGTYKRGAPGEYSDKPYDQNNRRLYPNKPCHTIPACFYANFVHPYEDRNFTPREGARIQSFPDWYRFAGKPTVVSTRLLSREERHEELHLSQYNQIGNAVPPLLAFHLASHIRKLLGA
jgi:DNA (cytosine-5)-methyltransferase 1